ncbi:SAM-dependent methyltransferase [Micromonospora sp. WMMD1102]|uniref:SAM-dependent methyltransferase n=1 Tax=Micromonospora sp. WMMD1102 TaxID=3016105 RepID=UPI002414DDE0|nr:SAM-dependent methyltransferase [Micromonospora sp. WMMD1102]MDG4786299.1 SAM-dependent methyltransferase [Micromonospora sp. WMMD1102]
MPDPGSRSPSVEGVAARIDTTVPHPARRYDYLLGGKDNFAADRESAEAMRKVYPTARMAVQENGRFLRRAVSYLAREAGIRQFLDIGTGIPSVDNTHEVAQSIAPESRIVHVDNDPIVLTHARALLTSTAQGRTAYLDADLRRPREILGHPDLLATLDLAQPVAVLLVAIMHFIVDEDDPYGLVEELLAPLPSGSALVMTHFTNDFLPPELVAKIEAAWRENPANGQGRARTAEEIGRFYTDLELVSPGIVPLAEWRAESEPQPRPAARDVTAYGAVGYKP